MTSSIFCELIMLCLLKMTLEMSLKLDYADPNSSSVVIYYSIKLFILQVKECAHGTIYIIVHGKQLLKSKCL